MNNPVNDKDEEGNCPLIATMLIGAGIGAAISAGAEIISEASQRKNVDWKRVGIQALGGAAAGLVMGSGVGLETAAIASAGIASATSVATDLYDRNRGSKISNSKIVCNAIAAGVVGLGAGAFGGSGVQSAQKFTVTTVKNVVYRDMDEVVVRMMPVRACDIVSGFAVSSLKAIGSTAAIVGFSATERIADFINTRIYENIRRHL